MVFPFVLLRGEPVFSFLFLSQKELPVQHVKCQLTSFPRKGRVLGFGMVSAVATAFGQAAVLSGCVPCWGAYLWEPEGPACPQQVTFT